MTDIKRKCNKSEECKIVKCKHRGIHNETSFCDAACDTFGDAICIKEKKFP